MTTTADAAEHRTKQWALHLQLFEEGDLTTAHVVLDTGDISRKFEDSDG